MASVARQRQSAEFPPRRRRVRKTLFSWLSARRYTLFFLRSTGILYCALTRALVHESVRARPDLLAAHNLLFAGR